MTDYMGRINKPDVDTSIAYGQTKEQADEQVQRWQKRKRWQERTLEIDESTRFKVKHPFIK